MNSEDVTRRAEQIRETTGSSWESACLQAERERCEIARAVARGPLRTATGQTGEDAYAYELAQLANAERELSARRIFLEGVIAAERAAAAPFNVGDAVESRYGTCPGTVERITREENGRGDPFWFVAVRGASGSYGADARDLRAQVVPETHEPAPVETIDVVCVGPNLPSALQRLGTFHIHAKGCAHLTRAPLKQHVRDADEMTVSSLVELCDDIYAPDEFGCESGEFVSDFHVAPCVKFPTEG